MSVKFRDGRSHTPFPKYMCLLKYITPQQPAVNGSWGGVARSLLPTSPSTRCLERWMDSLLKNLVRSAAAFKFDLNQMQPKVGEVENGICPSAQQSPQTCARSSPAAMGTGGWGLKLMGV